MLLALLAHVGTAVAGEISLNHVLADLARETDEVFEVVLIEADGGLIEGAVARVTLLDDDALPWVSIGNAVAMEGDDLVFPVRIRGEWNETIELGVVLTAGSTAGSSDVSPPAGTLTFPPGVNHREIRIPVIDDDLVEGPERVEVTVLVYPGNPQVRFDRNQAIGWIIDNDLPTAEGIKGYRVEASRVGSTSADVTLTALNARGEAIPGGAGPYKIEVLDDGYWRAPAVISEVVTGPLGWFQIQATENQVNLTGWTLELYDRHSWPLPAHVYRFPDFGLAQIRSPIVFRFGWAETDGWNIRHLRNTIDWRTDADGLARSEVRIAAILRDATGAVMDLFAMGETDLRLVPGLDLTPESGWDGFPIRTQPGSPDPSFTRIGGGQNRRASISWVKDSPVPHKRNPNLFLGFIDPRRTVTQPVEPAGSAGQAWSGRVTWEGSGGPVRIQITDSLGRQAWSTPLARVSPDPLTLTLTPFGPAQEANNLPSAVRISLVNTGPTYSPADVLYLPPMGVLDVSGGYRLPDPDGIPDHIPGTPLYWAVPSLAPGEEFSIWLSAPHISVLGRFLVSKLMVQSWRDPIHYPRARSPIPPQGWWRGDAPIDRTGNSGSWRKPGASTALRGIRPTFRFNGVDDAIQVVPGPAMRWGTTNLFQVMALVKLDPGSPDLQVIFERSGQNQVQENHAFLIVDGRPAFRLNDRIWKPLPGTRFPDIRDGSWHCVGMTLSPIAPRGISFSVDLQVAAVNAFGAGTNTFPGGGSGLMWIGRDRVGAILHGEIQEIACYVVGSQGSVRMDHFAGVMLGGGFADESFGEIGGWPGTMDAGASSQSRWMTTHFNRVAGSDTNPVSVRVDLPQVPHRQALKGVWLNGRGIPFTPDVVPGQYHMELGEIPLEPRSHLAFEWTGDYGGFVRFGKAGIDNVYTIYLRLTEWKDSDRDGVPDVWETLLGRNPFSADPPDLDTDGDGRTDIEEILAATDPTSASSILRPVVESSPGEPIRLRWQSTAATTYFVFRASTPDSDHWEPVAILRGNGQPLVYEPPMIDGPESFYRVSVRLPIRQ
jgi:hypothetical protein